jgi:P4 family phage/plasmid primase-like protien
LNGIKCKNLKHYNANREKLLTEIPGGRDTAKRICIAIMNNGNSDYEQLSPKPKWLVKLRNEFKRIHKALAELDPDAFHKHREHCIDMGKKHNHEGSYTFTLLTAWENDILQAMWQYFGCPENAVLCYDGLMLRKEIKNRKMTYDLKACADHVHKELGIRVNITEKKMNNGFRTPATLPKYTNPVQKVLLSPHSNQDFADYVLAVYKNRFLVFDKVLYAFNTSNGIWHECEDSSILHNLLSHQVHKKLHDAIFGIFTAEQSERQALTLKAVNTLRNWNSKEGIIKSIKASINVKTDPFDNNPTLIGFQNGVYDLKAFEFRKGRQEDYVMKTMPFKLRGPNKKKTKTLWGFINSIMPDEEERDYILEALATTLYGKCVQNIFIITGEGGNGKDCFINRFMRSMLGDYFYYGCTATLTERRKSDLNQGVANMHKKRMVIWSEPPADSPLQGATMKETTGVAVVNARGLYSKNTETHIHSTVFILCNDKPPIDNIDGGVARRVRVKEFNVLFKPKEEIAKMTNVENVSEANQYFDSHEFRVEHRLELFHILLDYWRQFQENGYEFTHTPQHIRDLSASYLRDCDEFMGWFDEVYERSEEKDDFIQLKDVYQEFRDSDVFMNYSKLKKRQTTRKKMIERLKRKPCFKGDWKDRHTYMVRGQRKETNSVIMRYKKRRNPLCARG